MRAVAAILRKELLILSRDVHGLLVLFAMPIAFILILSLAMRDEYASHGDASIDVWVVDADGSEDARRALALLSSQSVYRLVPAPSGASLDDLRERLLADAAPFVIHVPAGYFARFQSELDPEAAPPQGEPIRILAGPSVRQPMALLLEGAVKEAVARLRLDRFVRELRTELGDTEERSFDRADETQPIEAVLPADAIALTRLFRGAAREEPPSSVQQNVPAWLVFSMFFVVIPLSTTFISERQHGTLGRLRSMDVSAPLLFAGKLVPYVLINQLQVVMMLSVGVHVVPLLGGESLSLGSSRVALACMALSVSLGAIGFALLISVVARTTEQATVLGGAGSIVLGAIGGIMVPKFLMPASMQTLAWLSPMAWGLEGFLDVLLRQGGVVEILPEAAVLVGFGIAALSAASFLLKRHAD